MGAATGQGGVEPSVFADAVAMSISGVWNPITKEYDPEKLKAAFMRINAQPATKGLPRLHAELGGTCRALRDALDKAGLTFRKPTSEQVRAFCYCLT